MSDTQIQPAKDWAGRTRPYLFAWGMPSLAVIGGAFAPAAPRTVIWVLALVWMGTACLVNARRCGRTHCRYTGPYYLVLSLPVLLHGLDLVSLGPYGWWLLGGLILLGGKAIWWASERAWGKFSEPR